jgi:hypothetical protein
LPRRIFRNSRCDSRAISAFDLPVSSISHAIEPDTSTRSIRSRDSTDPVTSSVVVRNGSAAATSRSATPAITSSAGTACSILTSGRLRNAGGIPYPECARECLRRRKIIRHAVSARTATTAAASQTAVGRLP